MASAPKQQSGMALLEALVGMLIFSIGILALMGLQAQAIRNTIEAKYRNEASYLANQIVGYMWVDRAVLTDYDTGTGSNDNMENWRDQVAALLPGVTAGGTNSPMIDVAGGSVTVTIFWKLPGTSSEVRQFRVLAQINGT
jgi:type IV pilus assembly protein PilV